VTVFLKDVCVVWFVSLLSSFVMCAFAGGICELDLLLQEPPSLMLATPSGNWGVSLSDSICSQLS
jgi:hypothetical protein